MAIVDWEGEFAEVLETLGATTPYQSIPSKDVIAHLTTKHKLLEMDFEATWTQMKLTTKKIGRLDDRGTECMYLKRAASDQIKDKTMFFQTPSRRRGELLKRLEKWESAISKTDPPKSLQELIARYDSTPAPYLTTESLMDVDQRPSKRASDTTVDVAKFNADLNDFLAMIGAVDITHSFPLLDLVRMASPQLKTNDTRQVTDMLTDARTVAFGSVVCVYLCSVGKQPPVMPPVFNQVVSWKERHRWLVNLTKFANLPSIQLCIAEAAGHCSTPSSSPPQTVQTPPHTGSPTSEVFMDTRSPSSSQSSTRSKVASAYQTFKTNYAKVAKPYVRVELSIGKIMEMASQKAKDGWMRMRLSESHAVISKLVEKGFRCNDGEIAWIGATGEAEKLQDESIQQRQRVLGEILDKSQDVANACEETKSPYPLPPPFSTEILDEERDVFETFGWKVVERDGAFALDFPT